MLIKLSTSKEKILKRIKNEGKNGGKFWRNIYIWSYKRIKKWKNLTKSH